MEAHKRFTGNQLNKLHGAKGRRVWAEKPYDRDIRDGRFTQVLWYVINNPKKAGITGDPINWVGTWINSLLEQEYIASYRNIRA